MLLLEPRDSSLLSILTKYENLPVERQREYLNKISDSDARTVGEVLVNLKKYEEVSPDLQAVVKQFRDWHEANLRIARARASRRQRRAS